MKNPDQPFSYAVNVGHVSGNPVAVRLEADEREREALARTWEVTAIHSLSAEFQVQRWKRDGVRVSGTVRAEVEQPCVVTLEPVFQTIDEPVSALFVPEGSRLARMTPDGEGEIVVEAEGPDMPEPFSGDSIDLGAVAAEFVAMAINHYPRKPGAVFEGVEDSDEIAEEIAEAPSPFAALKDWKGKPH